MKLQAAVALLVSGGLFLAIPRPVHAADSVFLSLKGHTQGTIAGASTTRVKGTESSIPCLSYQLDVTTPRDAVSGHPTGRRHYQPIVIRKRIDQSSPKLMKALVNNESVDGTLKLYRPNIGIADRTATGELGSSDQFYTIDFTDGSIVSIKQIADDTKVPGTASEGPVEEVSFVFRQITWTWTDGNVQASDDWEARAALPTLVHVVRRVPNPAHHASPRRRDQKLH